MAEIIAFAEGWRRLVAGEPAAESIDEFLLREGLDLLAAYRSISDMALRQRLKLLIEEAAAFSSLPR